MNMKINLYFHIHIPKFLNGFNILDKGLHQEYFNNHMLDEKTREYYEKIRIFSEALKNELSDEFKISLGISGVSIDIFEERGYDLNSLKELIDTDKVELIGETYYNSLSGLYSKNEFLEQVRMQSQKLNDLFGKDVKTFKNTSLLYDTSMSSYLKEAGFETIIVDNQTNFDSTNIYTDGMNNLLLKNDQSNSFLKNIDNLNPDNESGVLNIYLDFKEIKDMNDFVKKLISFKNDNLNKKHEFVTPSDLVSEKTIFLSHSSSLEDFNNIQKSAINKVHEIEETVKNKACPYLLKTWRYLTSKDHIDFMNYEHIRSDKSPYDNYINFNNILQDIISRAQLN